MQLMMLPQCLLSEEALFKASLELSSDVWWEASTHWTCKHHPLFRFLASVCSGAGVLSDLKSSDLQRAIVVRALLLRL